MIIYPEIALRNGRCATLRKGQMTLPEDHGTDPLDVARDLAEQGAEWLHVVDLDAVGRRDRDNTRLIAEIIRAVDIPVQVAGGIHKPEHVQWWINRGAECVVFGSAAYLAPGNVRKAAKRYPYRVLVSVDVRADAVMVDGWARPTGTAPLAFLQEFDEIELAGAIVNDIDHDLDFPDATLALLADLGRQLRTPVIASGVAKSLDLISTLKHLGTIAGAVVGRALHHGLFTLEGAQRIAVEPGPRRAATTRATGLRRSHDISRLSGMRGRIPERGAAGSCGARPASPVE